MKVFIICKLYEEEEATISVAGAYSGSGGITGQSLTIANLFKAIFTLKTL